MFDETLADRVRTELSSRAPFSERKMFGGLAFLINGHMACGIIRDELMVRTGPQGYEEALAVPYARAMDFTGRPMRGIVIVSPPSFADEGLGHWLEKAVAFTTSLPPKSPSPGGGGRGKAL